MARSSQESSLAEESAEPERQPRAKRVSREVRIARTPMGKGVFAGRNYQTEEIVGEILGTIIDDALYESNYCMDLGGDRCLEPDSPYKFVNHSCQPNCELHWVDHPGSVAPLPDRHIYLLAIDDIRSGDQLTIDYAWPARLAVRCRCKSPDCRGWIVAADEVTKIVVA